MHLWIESRLVWRCATRSATEAMTAVILELNFAGIQCLKGCETMISYDSNPNECM